VLLCSNNTLNVSRAGSGAPVELDLRKAVFRGSPYCFVPTTRSTFRVPHWAPPLNWIFVKPGSGARRAALFQQHAQRAGSGAPVELDLRKAMFGGSPCYLVSNNTLNVSRASLGAPVELDLRKAGFRGSPCCFVPTTRSTFRVPDRAPPLALDLHETPARVSLDITGTVLDKKIGGYADNRDMDRQNWFCGIVSVVVLAFAGACASPPSVERPLPVVQPPVEEPSPPVQAVSRTDELMAGILVCLRAGDFEGALALFDEFSEEDAKTANVRLLKTSVYVSAGCIPEGRDLVNEVISDEPENADAFYALFGVESVAGNKQPARAALDTALKIDENHIPALNALGTLYVQNDSWRLATAQFDKVLSISPADLTALTGKASVLRFQRRSDEAMKLADEAVLQHPGQTQGYTVRAQLFRDTGKMGKALDDLVSAEELDPGDYWVSYDKGRTLLALNRSDEALLAFERAIALDKTEFAAYIYSAGILADRGDFDSAEQHYNELARLNPDYFYAYEGIGMLKMRNKEYAAARDAFLVAYAKAPTENGYAVLATLNALRVQKPFEVKPFLETAMRVVKRGTLDYAMLRMLNDFNGDVNVARQIETEKNTLLKGKMTFYLAEFYDICGKPSLANAYYEKCREVNRRDTVEWRLNEWKMEERSLLVRAPSQGASPAP
jgi:tetratricopeptide (TPR) repeat protein